MSAPYIVGDKPLDPLPLDDQRILDEAKGAAMMQLHDDAMAAWNSASESARQSLHGQDAWLCILLCAGKYDECLAAAERFPAQSNPYPWNIRVECLRKLKRNSESHELALYAARLFPTSARTIFTLAKAEKDAGNIEKAIALRSMGMSINASDWDGIAYVWDD